MINEVAPPGFGHTKPDKSKGVKVGGTAAAMKKAQEEGRIPKEFNIYALMWAMKKKGAKPRYKPGTNKKYKKYQKECNQLGKLLSEFLIESEDAKSRLI